MAFERAEKVCLDCGKLFTQAGVPGICSTAHEPIDPTNATFDVVGAIAEHRKQDHETSCPDGDEACELLLQAADEIERLCNGDEAALGMALAQFKRHTEAVDAFLSELYGIMVDPLASGVHDIQGVRDALLDSARRSREALSNQGRIGEDLALERSQNDNEIERLRAMESRAKSILESKYSDTYADAIARRILDGGSL